MKRKFELAPSRTPVRRSTKDTIWHIHSLSIEKVYCQTVSVVKICILRLNQDQLNFKASGSKLHSRSLDLETRQRSTDWATEAIATCKLNAGEASMRVY